MSFDGTNSPQPTVGHEGRRHHRGASGGAQRAHCGQETYVGISGWDAENTILMNMARALASGYPQTPESQTPPLWHQTRSERGASLALRSGSAVVC